MRNYEIMYILKADLDDAAREAAMQDLQKLLEENGAQVKNTDVKLGLRDLAYPINDETKGFYVVLKVSADETPRGRCASWTKSAGGTKTTSRPISW